MILKHCCCVFVMKRADRANRLQLYDPRLFSGRKADQLIGRRPPVQDRETAGTKRSSRHETSDDDPSCAGTFAGGADPALKTLPATRRHHHLQSTHWARMRLHPRTGKAPRSTPGLSPRRSTEQPNQSDSPNDVVGQLGDNERNFASASSSVSYRCQNALLSHGSARLAAAPRLCLGTFQSRR